MRPSQLCECVEAIPIDAWRAPVLTDEERAKFKKNREAVRSWVPGLSSPDRGRLSEPEEESVTK